MGSALGDVNADGYDDLLMGAATAGVATDRDVLIFPGQGS